MLDDDKKLIIIHADKIDCLILQEGLRILLHNAKVLRFDDDLRNRFGLWINRIDGAMDALKLLDNVED